MTPDCTDRNNILNKTTPAPNAPTIIPLNSPDYNKMTDMQYFLNKMHSALGMIHHPEECLMCTNDYCNKIKIHGPTESLNYGGFKYHMNGLLSSNGQSPNREVVEAMYKTYQEIVERVRQHSKILNRPGYIEISIDLLV